MSAQDAKKKKPKQREGSGGARPVLVGQQAPAFPQDGHGQPNKQPFRNLPIIVCHCSLREGLRRPLQQTHSHLGHAQGLQPLSPSRPLLSG